MGLCWTTAVKTQAMMFLGLYEWFSPTGDVTRYDLYVIGSSADKPVINKSNIRDTYYVETGSGDYIVN